MDAGRAAVVFWQKRDGLAAQHERMLQRLGWDVVRMLPDAPLPADLALVLCYGPLGSLVPLARQLQAIPTRQRPRLALLMTEQLPNPSQPEWLRYPLSLARSSLERLAFQRSKTGQWQLRRGMQWLTGMGFRYRYYGDLFWLRRAGLLSVLALWSQWTAGHLQAHGFSPVVLQPTYNPALGCDMGLERDIPVLWLGKIGSERRRILLDRVRTELSARGVEMLVIDGEENPYVFGEARTLLLNRTKIMLNLLRAEWDDNSLRFSLASHNGALIVTEPTLPHTAFRPGVHLISAPVPQLADTICHYLRDDEARQRTVQQAAALVQRHRTPGGYAGQIVNAAFGNGTHEVA